MPWGRMQEFTEIKYLIHFNEIYLSFRDNIEKSYVKDIFLILILFLYNLIIYKKRFDPKDYIKSELDCSTKSQFFHLIYQVLYIVGSYFKLTRKTGKHAL